MASEHLSGETRLSGSVEGHAACERDRQGVLMCSSLPDDIFNL